MAAKTPGSLCWADLMPADPPRARAFYEALFGWTIAVGPEQYGGYGLACIGRESPETMVAGISGTPGPEGTPPAWTAYFAVTDADATAEAAKHAGGTVFMEPFDVPGQGRMAVIADPTGGVFGIWQAYEHHGFGRQNEAGAQCWGELYTRDAAAALPFYETVLGHRHGVLSDDPGFIYFDTRVGDAPPESGVMQMGDSFPPEVPPHWLLYWWTSDVDGDVARLPGLGGQVIREPWDTPFGRVALVKDTEGALLALIDPDQRAEAA